MFTRILAVFKNDDTCKVDLTKKVKLNRTKYSTKNNILTLTLVKYISIQLVLFTHAIIK